MWHPTISAQRTSVFFRVDSKTILGNYLRNSNFDVLSDLLRAIPRFLRFLNVMLVYMLVAISQ